MNRTISLILAFTLCILIGGGTQAECEDELDDEKGSAVTIALTKLDVTDTTLKLSYKIKNYSEQDAWILAGIGRSGISATAFMDDDGQTLFLRRWFGEPMTGRGDAIDGRYVRLRAGENQTESISISIPVRLIFGLADGPGAQGLATRLVIEIGYYSGDLPEMIRGILEEEEKIIAKKPVVYPIYPTTIKEWFGGLLGFNEKNETLRQRDEEVLIPYTDQMLKGEQVLRLTVDDIHIPFKEIDDLSIKRYPPDLTRCSRVEIQYQPSMLEYFFPFAGQQSLLSREEIEYLRTEKTIVVEDSENIKTFAHDLNEGILASGIIRERSVAYVICYSDDEHLMSFPIYNDDSIFNEGKYRFWCRNGLQSLRALTPRVQPIELRVQCASNLKNLWRRLRLYHKAEKKRLKGSSGKAEMIYPTSTKWCETMVRAYKSAGMNDKWNMRPYICPSAGEGKYHYAMNPNCKPDSPLDMVLLFETKAGWNQHGGPELFTFDNHDPKGGCVLLNDGTVKFIRTKEELQQLRWK